MVDAGGGEMVLRTTGVQNTKNEKGEGKILPVDGAET